jgi:hypothetical protein
MIDLDVVDALRVGRVVSVEGRRVKVAVDKLKNGSHTLHRGSLVRNASVGGFVKITKGYANLIAKVDGEYIHEDRLGYNPAYRSAPDRVARTLELSLIGYLHDGRFYRGVREMPLLDNECFVLAGPELRAVHQFAPEGEDTFPLGVLATDPTQPVELGVNAIFASHVGIFGNTGSGKSYTLAKLYHQVFAQFGSGQAFRDRARVVLVDFNGEYVDRSPGEDDDSSDRSTEIIAGPDIKVTYRLSTRSVVGDRLPFSSEMLNEPVIWHVLLSATEKTQAPFIARALRSKQLKAMTTDAGSVLDQVTRVAVRATSASERTVDRLTANRLLWDVREIVGDRMPAMTSVAARFEDCLRFHGGDNQTYKWIENGRTTLYGDSPDWASMIEAEINVARGTAEPVDGIDLLGLKVVLQYYDDVAGGFANPEHIGPLIKRLHERLPDVKKVIEASESDLASTPLTVVSLQDVNLSMRKVVPLLLCKQLYDRKRRVDPTTRTYLNLVIDEAHNILSTESVRETEALRDYRLETFEEIVKEGRKFGVFLTIASQRPHDISETIVSQLHHYFLHRLVNNLDVRSIERAVAYLDAVSFESIPILATGTCVVAGVTAQVPVVVSVDALPPRAEPKSRTMHVVEAWTGAFDEEQS